MRAIVGGLERIENEIERGLFKFDIADEDIHLAIERRLIAMIGEPRAQAAYRRVRATIRSRSTCGSICATRSPP